MINKIKSKIKRKTNKLKGRFGSAFEDRNRTSVDLGRSEVIQPVAVGREIDRRPASDPGHDQILPMSDLEAPEGTLGPNKPLEGVPTPAAAKSDFDRATESFAWTGLKILQQVLNDSVGLFGPLASTVDGIAEYIGILENERQDRQDYRTLKTELNNVFKELTKLLQAAKTPAMKQLVVKAVEDIKDEVEKAVQKTEWRGTGQFTQAWANADDIERFYRKMQSILNSLIIKVNTTMIEAANEQVMNERLNCLPDSPAARYNSAQAETLHRGACTPETRIEVLRELREWSTDLHGHRIYWLNGMAGTGKTTIVYSVCKELETTGRLAASFFCSRQLPECRDVNRIVPTIAYQISGWSGAFREAIDQVLEKTPDVYNRPLADQFEHLIVEPLGVAGARFSAGQVVVIDALDECENPDVVDQLLKVLLLQGQALPVRFLVTSRPEAKIRDRMKSGQDDADRREMRLHELERTTVQQDIRVYLTAELESVNLSAAQIESLVERSGVLFIYAATLVRYVSDDNFSWSTSRLKRVFGLAKSPSLGPERNVDVLYTSILEAAARKQTEEEEKTLMTNVLYTVICAREPLSLCSISRLLDVNDTQLIAAALRPLHSVLQVADKIGFVTTLHESFPNYMLDKKRSGDWHCDFARHNSDMAHQCLEVIKMIHPPFNVCKLESSYVLDEQVPDLATRIARYIDDALSYACHYWAEHLCAAQGDNDFIQDVEEFMEDRFLMWLEVMNLKQYWSDAGAMLGNVIAWSRKIECSTKTKELIEDALRFVKTFYVGDAWRSTPHIYISGLTYWPHHRPLFTHYCNQVDSGVVMSGSAKSGQALRMLGVINTGNRIRSIAYSPVNAHIVSGSEDCTLRIWDAHIGQQMGQSLQGHTDFVTSVAYSPDGVYIVSGSNDCTLRIWNAHTGQPLGQSLQGHTDAVASVAYSPGGTRIVSGSHDFTLRIWDVYTGRQLGQPLEGHSDAVVSVIYSPAGAHIISGSSDCTLRIWDAHTSQQLGQPLQGHIYAVTSVAYSPDGTRIVSGSDDCTLCIWDAHTGQQLGQPLHGHTNRVTTVAYSPNGEHIVSGSDDCTLRIWDKLTGQQLGQPLQGHTDSATSITYSPDGMHIVSGSDDCTLHIWDAHVGQQLGQPLQGHTDAVVCVTYSPDGAQIASSSWDCTLRIWDAYTGQQLNQPLYGHTRPVTSVAYSPDGVHIVSGSHEPTPHVWEARTGSQLDRSLQGHTDAATSIAYSPNGAYIVSGSHDCTLRIWDANTGKQMGEPLQGHTSQVVSVAYSPDGANVVSGSHDHTLCVWDAQTSQQIGQRLQGHAGPVTSVAYSPNGVHIVSGSWDRTLRIWDAYTGQQLSQLPQCHADAVTSVAYSPDGERIVSGSWDCTLRVWDAHTGQILGQPLQGHRDAVTSVAYSPDGTHIVSGSRDRTVRIWGTKDQQQLGSSTSNSDPTSTSNTSYRNWTLDDDGWILSEQGRLLVWIPAALRASLLGHQTLLLISQTGSLHVDFTGAHLGEDWVQCYQVA